MKVIFTGTLARGFAASAIEAEPHVVGAVRDLHTSGQWTEVVDLMDPATMKGRFKADASGVHVVVFGNWGSGMEVYGPFGEHDAASDFGELNRGEDCEYEVFQVARACQTAAAA